MRKYLAFLLAFCLILALVPTVSAAGAVNGNCGDDAYWSFDAQTGTLSITGTGSTADYREFQGDSEVLFEKPWDHLREQVRCLVIGDGITRLGHQAFDNLPNLETVSFSDTVTEIGNFCFCFASKLKELELPSGLRAIGQQAFWCCNGLTEIHLPGTLTFIDACIFEECRNLQRVTIGYDPATPSLVLGNSPFRNCSALEEILVEEGHFGLKSIDGVLYTYDCKGLILQQYPLGKRDETFSIPDGTYWISQLAIEFPSYLKSVTVPASMEYIGGSSIWGGSMKEVCFLGSAPELAADALGVLPLTVYYPANDPTWTEEVRSSQYFTLTWVPYNPANPFRDVPPGVFCEKAVLWAAENGITSGMTETTFAPKQECTRAQVVTFLWRSEGCPEPESTEHPFTDVKKGAFYYKAMLWAVEKGITNGVTATTFGPGNPCDRGTVVTFLWRAKGKPAPTTSEHPFTDVTEGKFYYKAMLWAVENGITSGTAATTFAPGSICNRGQVVTFLYRAYAN